MLITGKTSEENLTSMTTIQVSFVKTGKQEPSLVSIKKAVFIKQLALIAMVGKNLNIILTITRLSPVKIRNANKICNALFSITKKKKE